MQTIHPQTWGTRNLSYWLTLLIALGIVYIGVRFMIDPNTGATGFGIPFATDHDFPYGHIKGIRYVFSGMVLLPLLILRMRRATAWVFTSAIIIPVIDTLIVLSANGASDIKHLLIHGLTAVFMIFTSYLLFKQKK